MKILVVDDDQRIRRMTADALAAAGHIVSEADCGEVALAMLAEGTPDLLVSDILMPGMKGTELARHARALYPDLAVQFISGDVGDTPAEELAGFPLLTKPFSAVALHRAIAEVAGTTLP